MTYFHRSLVIITCVVLFFSAKNLVASPKKTTDFNLKIGGGAGLKFTSLYVQGVGFGIAPDYFVRVDMLFFKKSIHGLGMKADLGYTWAKLPIESGYIHADFFTISTLFNYKIFLKKFLPKNNIKNLNLTFFVGPYLNTRISSLYYHNENTTEYNFNDNFNPISSGITTGLGLEIEIWYATIFLETHVTLAITGDIRSTTSNIMQLQETSQYAIQLKLGATFKIFPLKTNFKETSMFLKKTQKQDKKK